jgi:hypothetical protein
MLVASVQPEHIAATLVDLACRGYVDITEATPSGDWLIARPAPGQHPADGDVLLRYERTLLRGILRGRRPARLSNLNKRARKAIGRVHGLLTKDAVARDPDILVKLRSFRDHLRQFQPEGNAEAWTFYRDNLPYAVAFGLTLQWADRCAELVAPSAVGASLSATSDLNVRIDRFQFAVSLLSNSSRSTLDSHSLLGHQSHVHGHYGGGHHGGHQGGGHHG